MISKRVAGGGQRSAQASCAIDADERALGCRGLWRSCVARARRCGRICSYVSHVLEKTAKRNRIAKYCCLKAQSRRKGRSWAIFMNDRQELLSKGKECGKLLEQLIGDIQSVRHFGERKRACAIETLAKNRELGAWARLLAAHRRRGRSASMQPASPAAPGEKRENLLGVVRSVLMN